MQPSPHHTLLAAAALFASGIATAAEPLTRASNLLQPAAGTVVAEQWRKIGFGFREVSRSQVNAPGAFEGIGHFSFVYYKGDKICQCGSNEISISPNGVYAIYTDVTTGKLMSFNAASRRRKELSQSFVGYPKMATWNLASPEAVVTLEKYENGVGNMNVLTVKP